MVYVDELRHWGRWRYGESCHMTADSDNELHAMAARVGLRREWFQDGRHPHYDLIGSKRKLAIQWGAIEVKAKERMRCVAQMNCPRCRKETEAEHVHDCAHGIEETHMVGSERYVCKECGYAMHKAEGEAQGLKFVCDQDGDH